MTPHVHPLLAPLYVGAALIAGVWVVAVLDGAVEAWVARRPLGAGKLLAGPLWRAALLLSRRRTRTERPDAESWALAPALLGGLAATAVVVVPVAPAVAVADVQAGIVLFGAAVALVMVAVFLHGWSANSAFPMIGGYRFIALALSFEMPLAIVLIAAALPAESLQVGEIVRSQASLWNVVRQPLGLPLYLVAASGAAFWGPLAFPDAPDLAGGTSAEVAGPALLVWRLSRGLLLVALAAMGAAVFLGGWLGPWLPGPVWLALKTIALLSVILGAGHYLARIRLEDFVVVAWTVLIPLALADVFISGLLTLR